MHEIPLSRPDITNAEIDLVVQTMKSGRLALGPMAEKFEQAVAASADRAHGVAVSSGTAGLHLALLALGIGPGDEVITTPFSFVASANCILYVGAKPVFVDVCPRTLNMDPEKLAAAITPRTKAIVAVETFGNPAYMDEYEAIAQRHEIPLVEDCCEALGVSHRGRRAGSFGRIGVLAFYPNKQITTGEGGCIVTDDRRLANLCRSMRNQGRAIADARERPSAAEAGAAPTAGAIGGGGGSVGSWLSHERLGYNFRMSELNAALGVAQMRRLDEIIRKRQHVANMYFKRLSGHHDLILPTLLPETEMSWFVFVVRLGGPGAWTRDERDRIIAGLRRHEIGASDYFPCIHTQPFYEALAREGQVRGRAGDFPIAESVSTRTIALPFFNDLTERDVDIVCGTLELMMSRENLGRG
ncbi:MAG: DegT/DnrJ/EryC1/StrS family aminotransferase [Phycisphaeraceae bacterium]|nr:DegT/DnrJ/EryC1/StrS family aminotransferase [Phycisphaeraceae bacterium]